MIKLIIDYIAIVIKAKFIMQKYGSTTNLWI